MRELLKKLLARILHKESPKSNVIELPQSTLAKESKDKLLREKQQNKKKTEAARKEMHQAEKTIGNNAAKRKPRRKKAN